MNKLTKHQREKSLPPLQPCVARNRPERGLSFASVPCTAALPALLCRARSYPSSSHQVWPVAGEPPIPVFRPLIFISGECTHSSVNALVVANFTRLWADLGIGLNIHLSRPCFVLFCFVLRHSKIFRLNPGGPS